MGRRLSDVKYSQNRLFWGIPRPLELLEVYRFQLEFFIFDLQQQSTETSSIILFYCPFELPLKLQAIN